MKTTVLLMLAIFVASPTFAQSKKAKRIAKCHASHTGWTDEDCERIIRHDVWIGMTADMVSASLGGPIRTNSTQTAKGVSLQTVYECCYSSAKWTETLFGNPRAGQKIYIYYDGTGCELGPGECKVSSIQTSR